MISLDLKQRVLQNFHFVKPSQFGSIDRFLWFIEKLAELAGLYLQLHAFLPKDSKFAH